MTVKASDGLPPYWDGAESLRASSISSKNELGHPFVRTIGSASACSPSNRR